MENASINFNELLEEAIRAKRAKELAKYSAVEQTPEGERLTWHVTPEQIARINIGDREALDAFYFDEDNFLRLRYSVYKFMRHNTFVKAVASHEDLLQQVYADLRLGLLKLRPFDHAIGCAIFHSFRYAPVGGIDEVYVFKTKEEKRCQKQAN